MPERLAEWENPVLKFSFACKEFLKPFLLPFLALLFSIFTAFSLLHSVQENVSVIVLASIFIVGGIFYCSRSIAVNYWEEGIEGFLKRRSVQTTVRILKWCVGISSIILILAVVILDALKRPRNLISLAGLTALVLVCFLFSAKHALVKWRLILCGLVFQCIMGLAMMRCKYVFNAVTWMAKQITGYLGFSKPAAIFLFGKNYKDHELVMGLVAVGVFFNSTTYFLYHIGVLQVTIESVGSAFSFIVPATRVECFAAVSNIFFGPDATMIMVKPMISTVTKAQLHTLLTTGMASIDAGLIQVFESIGVPASHLLSASLMTAPAAVAFSRLLSPEEEKMVDCQSLAFERTDFSSIWEAIFRGAKDGINFSVVIFAVLLAYVSLLEFADVTCTWFGNRLGFQELTLQVIVSYAFLPVVWSMGVEWSDCHEVSKLVALKTICNEFIAYEQLVQLVNNRRTGLVPSISVRSEAITSYALCGFSNIGTVATLVGFVSVVAPNRTRDVSGMSLRCLLASSCVCFSTACVAGI